MNWLSNKLLLSKPLLIFIGQLFYFEPTFFTLEKLFTEGTAFRVFSTTISRNSLYLASFHGFFFFNYWGGFRYFSLRLHSLVAKD